MARMFVALNTFVLSLIYQLVADVASVWLAALSVVTLLLLTSYLFFNRLQVAEPVQEKLGGQRESSPDEKESLEVTLQEFTEIDEKSYDKSLLDKQDVDDFEEEQISVESVNQFDEINEEHLEEVNTLEEIETEEKQELQLDEQEDETDLEDEFAFLEKNRSQNAINDTQVEHQNGEETIPDVGDRTKVLAELDEDVVREEDDVEKEQAYIENNLLNDLDELEELDEIPEVDQDLIDSETLFEPSDAKNAVEESRIENNYVEAVDSDKVKKIDTFDEENNIDDMAHLDEVETNEQQDTHETPSEAETQGESKLWENEENHVEENNLHSAEEIELFDGTTNEVEDVLEDLIQEEEVKPLTNKRMESTILSLVLEELQLLKRAKGPETYEQIIQNNLKSNLHVRDHYLFASLLRDHYIEQSEQEKVVNLLDELRERYKDHQVLLAEIDYYLSLYK